MLEVLVIARRVFPERGVRVGVQSRVREAHAGDAGLTASERLSSASAAPCGRRRDKRCNDSSGDDEATE